MFTETQGDTLQPDQLPNQPVKHNLAKKTGLLVYGLCAALLWLHVYHESFFGWFMREDSRFFSTAPFSFFDIWQWFTTAQNSMMQYRPIAKLLWSLPRYFGVFDPFVYTSITVAFIAATSVVFFFFLRFFGLYSWLALAGAAAYAFSTAHVVPLFWISAWHNTTVAFFCLSALLLRLQQRRWPALLCFYLALCSRNTAISWLLPLVLAEMWLLLQQHQFSFFRLVSRCADLLVLVAVMIFALYVLRSPFAGVSNQVQIRLLPDFDTASRLWFYFTSVFSTQALFDSGERWLQLAGWVGGLLAAFFVFLFVTALLRRGRQLLPAAMIIGGICLHLVAVGGRNMEYSSIMALGCITLFVWYLQQVISYWFERLPGRQNLLHGLTAIALLVFIYALTLPQVRMQSEYYLAESAMNRQIVKRFRQLDREYPRDILFEFENMGAIRFTSAHPSSHFFTLALEEFVPGRFFFYKPRHLGSGQGVQMHDTDAYFYRDVIRPHYQGSRVRLSLDSALRFKVELENHLHH